MREMGGLGANPDGHHPSPGAVLLTRAETIKSGTSQGGQPLGSMLVAPRKLVRWRRGCKSEQHADC